MRKIRSEQVLNKILHTRHKVNIKMTHLIFTLDLSGGKISKVIQIWVFDGRIVYKFRIRNFYARLADGSEKL